MVTPGMIRVFLLTSLLALAPGALAPFALAGETIRGITISTHLDGRDWGWDAIVPTLEDVRSVGANWVATHPYAWIEADGRVRFEPIDPAHPPAHLVRPIREAHAAGLKILIKPHLGYWGSPFSWRGEIEFATEEQWARFWESYSRWIVQLAAVCHEADGFVVGTELDRTLGFEDRWRQIIGAIREQTTLALTYAANWTHYRDVGFWDALDVIGIQAYFPLTETPHPSLAALEGGWARVMSELSEYARDQYRNVVFTELGYNRSFSASVEPWSYHGDGADAEPVQVSCMRAALTAIDRQPLVLGAFLWKWFPRPHPVGRNFQLATPAMAAAIRGIWRRPPDDPAQAGGYGSSNPR
jgi:hypothetical protein